MVTPASTPPPAPASYKVVIPLVITKKPDGSQLYVYEGGLLPITCTQEEIDRLLAEHFVEAISDAEAATPADPAAESN